MNRAPCWVTTSWDDGHPCDLRIAELLTRHALPGTFYIPAASQRDCMDARQVRTIGQTFEVGAHTLRHLRLHRMPDAEAAREMGGSKQYIEQILGRACRMFAPPGGRFRAAHLRMAEAAGFRGFRTTELMSLAMPRRHGGIAVMPTTMQLFRHPPLAYGKNALRRLRPLNLWLYLRRGRAPLAAAFDSLLDYAIQRGGAVHLWGHGWEIDECGNWDLLAQILAQLAARRNELRLVSNAALCNEVLAYECLTNAASNVVLPG